MKKMLLSLLIFTLLFPPSGGAQEPPTPIQEKDKEIMDIMVPRIDYKALIKALPVKDRRDIDDRKAQEEFLRGIGGNDEQVYLELSYPRFNEVKGDKAVAESYLVTLTAEAAKNFKSEVERLAAQYHLDIVKRFDSHGDHMVYVKCSRDMAEQLSRDLSVRWVTQDRIMPPPRQYMITVPQEKAKPKAKSQDLQRGPDFKKEGHVNGDWGLDLIDNSSGAFDNYYNSANNGKDARTYVLDDGISDFGAHWNINRLEAFAPGDYGVTTGPHGTEVAIMIASAYNGTATESKVISARHPISPPFVLQDWVTFLNSVRDDIIAKRPKYAQVNMSFGFNTVDIPGGVPTELNTPIASMISNDIPVIASTGQYTIGSTPVPLTPRADNWPIRVAGVLAVGMTNSDRFRLNTPVNPHPYCSSLAKIRHIDGSDVFAPGGVEFNPVSGCLQIGVLTYDNLGNQLYGVGTSLSAPIVAGVAAQYASPNKTYWPKAWMVNDAIFSTSTPGVVGNKGTGDADRFVRSNIPVNVCVNSASSAEGVARDSLVTCYSAYSNAQNAVMVRTNPNYAVPDTPSASISYAGSLQTNFVMPSANLAITGPAIVRTYQGSNQLGGYGFAYLDNVNPGVFADYTNNYTNLQWYLTPIAGGAVTIVNNSPSGLTWNPTTHYLTAVIYGTGWRYRTSTSMVNVRFYKNGSAVGSPPTTSYAGLVGGFPGLDQINADNPSNQLVGKGEVEVRVFVDGKEANRTKVRFN